MQYTNIFHHMPPSRERSAYERLESVLFFFAFVSFPLYVYASGGVQPSHLIAFAFSSLVLATGKMEFPKWMGAYLSLTIYVLLVEIFYTVSNNRSDEIVNAAYYFFNFLILMGVYNFFKDRQLELTGWALAISILVAFTGVVMGGFGLTVESEGGRSVGTFNNPNQLGYFSVCAASLAFLLNRVNVLGNFSTIVLIIVSFFLAIVSLSKAAIISLSCLLIFLVFPRKMTMGKGFVMVGGLAAVVSILIYLLQIGYFDQYLFFNRIANMQNEADSSLVERGYLAFLDGNALQVLLGLGERAVKDVVGHEVHSTIGSVFNTYGIIGFFLLMYLFFSWAKKVWNKLGFITFCGVCGPPMLYGITHNGMRFTIFWVLIGLSFVAARRVQTSFVEMDENGQESSAAL